MRARLVPIDGGPPIELLKELTLIGRGEDCDLRIDHKSVSKRHCVLVKTDGLVLVRDLGSTNGTRVNSQRVRRGSLLPNDVVAVANFRYMIKFGDGPAIPANESLDVPVPLPDDDSDAEDAMTARESLRVNDLPDVYQDPTPPRKAKA